MASGQCARAVEPARVLQSVGWLGQSAPPFGMWLWSASVVCPTMGSWIMIDSEVWFKGSRKNWSVLKNTGHED